jgi:hypothetical protein
VGDTAILLLIVIALPLVVTFVLGVISARGATPLVFHCLRCERDFHQPPHHRFPLACPRCRARDWSSPRP